MGDEKLVQIKLEYLSELNEADARHYAAIWAIELGWGGISKVQILTKMAMNTIRKGIAEINSGKKLKENGRIRKVGGGRKKVADKNPDVLMALNELLEENTAGDPMNHIKWTNKSTYNISDILQKKGYKISYKTVGRLLKQNDYTLKANSKSNEGVSISERDAQFQHINKKAEEFKLKCAPHISVDAKKKELVGEFKNSGRTWSKKGNFKQVNVYDFPSLANGKVTPYGAYDVCNNKGFVNVGISSDTGEFAVESIKKWWLVDGKKEYGDSKELLICADGGGSNGSRNKAWKYFLQQFANEFKLKITVCHYPSGTSKWNKIEHRLFSFISMNWKGKPLTDYEIIINLINATKTKTGLVVKSEIDKRIFEKGKKFTKEQINGLNIEYDSVIPKLNYTISPQI